MSARGNAILLVLAVVIVGCLASVLAKQVLGDVDPFTFAWLQILIGGVLLTAWTFWWRRERIPAALSREVWLYIIGIGVANFTIVRVMFLLSLARLPVNTHVYLTNFVGIVTLFLSVVMLRERPSWLQFAGALIAIAGVTVFFDEIPPPERMTGVVFVLIGVFALALTNNLVRKLAIVTEHKLSNNVISTLAVWIGGGPVVLYGIATDLPPAVTEPAHWGVIVLNAVIGIAVGLTVWNHVMRALRSYEASILASSSVIFVALFAVPILDETLAIHQMAGIGLMMVGLVLSQLRPVSSVRSR